MQLIPDVSTAYVDPFRDAKTLDHGLRHLQPAQRRDLPQGPASGRQEGREVPRLDRHRRHRVLRPRGRVLHLRRRALRGEAELELLRRRLRGGRLEHRPRRRGRQPRQQDPVQGRLLPGQPGRQARPTCATTSASSSSRPASSSSARTTRSAPAARREINYRFDTMVHAADDILKFKYIVKNTAEQWGKVGDLHAEAALRRQRLGHAHAPVAVERRQAAVLRREGLRRPVRHRPLVHRRPAQARPRGARVHEPDAQLATTAWSRASRRRSTWSTRPATARRRSASRSRARTRRPSASSSARRMPRATRTSRSRRS